MQFSKPYRAAIEYLKKNFENVGKPILPRNIGFLNIRIYRFTRHTFGSDKNKEQYYYARDSFFYFFWFFKL